MWAILDLKCGQISIRNDEQNPIENGHFFGPENVTKNRQINWSLFGSLFD
jgi:hypothetical protein